jgi:hypothetical protein
MKDSSTRSVQFSNARAVPIGRPGDYLRRTGFWYGAIGVVACWLGGARGVAAPLYRAVGDDHSTAAHDAHPQAHLGAVDSALGAAEAMLTSAACQVDAVSDCSRVELIARRVRAVIEAAAIGALVGVGALFVRAKSGVGPPAVS